MTPEWSNLVLATDIPDCEGDVLILDSLDVESDGRNSRHDLTKLEFVNFRVLDKFSTSRKNHSSQK